MPSLFPSTPRGWAWYISSALVLAAVLVANVNIHASHTRVGDEWKESDFTFLETDYPSYLIPLSQHPRDAALVVEDTVHYQPNSTEEWHSIFPAGSGGFVRLGPRDRLFGVSMFHQLHCLDKMRRAVVSVPSSEWESWHTQHCINYLRQMLLCAASVRLEPVKVQVRASEGEGEGEGGSRKVDGLGLEHECRDWSLLRKEAEANFKRWPEDPDP